MATQRFNQGHSKSAAGKSPAHKSSSNRHTTLVGEAAHEVAHAPRVTPYLKLSQSLGATAVLRRASWLFILPSYVLRSTMSKRKQNRTVALVVLSHFGKLLAIPGSFDGVGVVLDPHAQCGNCFTGKGN
jgi:hypothetical protein